MKQDGRDSKKRIAFPIQLFAEQERSAELPDEIHVVPTGKWSHPYYGEMEITSVNVAEFVQNFKDKVRKDLPITAGHDNGMNGGELPAIGWFKELIDRGVKGLYAVVEWTEEGKHLLSENAFKYFSPEFYEEYSDPETGEKRSHVLVGGALTNRPYFKELDPVVAFSEPRITNQFTYSMQLKDILTKKPTELSEPEKAFVREHKSELTAEQSTAFASVFDESGTAETPEEKQAREEKEAGDANEAKGLNRDGSTKEVVASEKGMVKISAAELAVLQTKANQGQEAFSQVETMKLEAEVSAFTFSETNKAGKILPKQKEEVVAFMKTLSEKQREQFRTIVNGLPKADAELFSEIGDGGSGGTGLEAVKKQIEDAVQAEIKASENKLSYASALRKVYSEKPELKTAYEAAMAEQGA